MARNKFDVDETLETPFDARHLKRLLVYAKKYKTKIAVSFVLSAVAAIIGLLSPIIVQNAVDNYMKSEADIPMLLLSGGGVLLCIVVSVLLTKKRSVLMTEVGQNIVYDIRKDLFEHMQQLSFDFYDCVHR